jgi:hypothetical protein
LKLSDLRIGDEWIALRDDLRRIVGLKRDVSELFDRLCKLGLDQQLNIEKWYSGEDEKLEALSWIIPFVCLDTPIPKSVHHIENANYNPSLRLNMLLDLLESTPLPATSYKRGARWKLASDLLKKFGWQTGATDEIRYLRQANSPRKFAYALPLVERVIVERRLLGYDWIKFESRIPLPALGGAWLLFQSFLLTPVFTIFAKPSGEEILLRSDVSMFRPFESSWVTNYTVTMLKAQHLSGLQMLQCPLKTLSHPPSSLSSDMQTLLSTSCRNCQCSSDALSCNYLVDIIKKLVNMVEVEIAHMPADNSSR